MNLLVVLSHDLTDKQINEAKEKLIVKNIKIMPQNLKDVWKNINPDGELPLEELDKVRSWIEKESNLGDYILIQGDFGAVYYLVDFCFIKKRIPIYSTSTRRIEEIKKGEQIFTSRIFEHKKFRKYKKYTI